MDERGRTRASGISRLRAAWEDLLEVLDRLELGLAVRARARLALVFRHRFEGVRNDLFEQLPERLVVELCQALQHLYQARLHANTELDPLDSVRHRSHDNPASRCRCP